MSEDLSVVVLVKEEEEDAVESGRPADPSEVEVVPPTVTSGTLATRSVATTAILVASLLLVVGGAWTYA
jgi:hypothetical protein